MDKAIEAAARIIDPLAFEEQGSCPPRGYECHTPEQLSRVIAVRKRRALSVAKRMIAAYQAASGEARDAKRYRCFRDAFGLAVWGGDGQIAWHEDEIDAAIDAAIATREGE